MDGGARGKERGDEGRGDGTACRDGDSSDMVRPCPLPQPRGGTNLNVTMGSEAPELSVLLPHAGICVRPATPDLPREEKPHLLFAGCVIDLQRDVQQS